MIPCLVVKNGSGAGQLLRLDRPVAHIGRGSGNDLVVDDSNVSRVHARLARTEAGIAVIDLDTTNGTTVAGDPIKARVLHEGDEIVLGGTLTLTFGHRDLPEEPWANESHDPLTGALSKAAWLENLQFELTRSRREKLTVTVAVLEIDSWARLAKVHREPVLQQLAEILRLDLRTHAAVGYLEEGRFGLIFPELWLTSAKTPLDAVRERVAERPFPCGNLTVCIGASGPGPEATTVPELMENAEAALQQGQSEGKNRTVLHGIILFGETRTQQRQRRLATRAESKQSVTCIGPAGRFEANVRDVGLQGLRLMVDRELKPGESYRLCLAHENEAGVSTRVIWCKPARTGYQAGLVYMGDDKQLELTWLRSYLERLRGPAHDFQERRRQQRSRVNVPAWINGLQVANLANLSLEGALVVTQTAVEGPDVVLKVRTPDSPALHARLVHSYELPPHWFLGVEFRELDDIGRQQLERMLTAF